MKIQPKHPYLTFEEMKEKYPNEWVLLGNHQQDEKENKVIGGYVITHSPNKKDLVQGRKMLQAYPTGTWVYTGEFKKVRTIGLFKRVSHKKV